MTSAEQELVDVTYRLLESIATADWETYAALCDPTLTCFEPETRSHLVEGMAFHRFYFDLGPSRGPRTTTLVTPHVRLLGETAIVSYVRLVQRVGADGQPFTAAFNETRVWQRQDQTWRHVHFHRSEPGAG
jgi:ketosteroid isomerase-like protein